MAIEGKKRGFFSRLFFQDTDSNSKKQESFTPVNPVAEAAPVVEMPVAADKPEKWVKLALNTDGVQSHIELTIFPFDIGRKKSPFGITLDDTSISGHHATVSLQNGVLTIVDVNSKNGVLINDNKVTPSVITPLERGTKVKIGRTEIVVTDYYEASAKESEKYFAETEYLSQTVFLEPEPAAPEPKPISEPLLESVQQLLKPEPVSSADTSIICGKCSLRNKAASKFCTGCGSSLAPPAPKPAGSTPKKFCDKCGSKNTGMNNFCEKCGNRLV